MKTDTQTGSNPSETDQDPEIILVLRGADPKHEKIVRDILVEGGIKPDVVKVVER